MSVSDNHTAQKAKRFCVQINEKLSRCTVKYAKSLDNRALKLYNLYKSCRESAAERRNYDKGRNTARRRLVQYEKSRGVVQADEGMRI